MDKNSEAGHRERDPQRARHVYGALLVLVAGLFLLFSWGLPHQWVFLAGLLLAALALLAVREIPLAIKLACISLAVVLLLLNSLIRVKDGSKDDEVIQNALAIRLALERYAMDHGGVYALTMEPVQDEGYLPKFPRNPYPRKDAYYREQLGDELYRQVIQMQPLGSGYLPDELRAHLEWPGNFVYLPRIEAGSKGGYTVRGYSLLVFGRKHWEPGWWENAQDLSIVVYYYNSETRVEQTWR